MFSEKAFLQAIAENQLIIHKVCNLYTKEAADRQDLWQEILLNAWKGVQTYKGDAKFSTWLYRVALNTAITFLKKHQRRQSVTNHDQLALNAYSPDSGETDQLAAMSQAIAGLSAIDKALVTLYLDDMSYQEIGEIMGITENHVAVKMNRIKTRLRESGKKYLND